MGQTAREFDPGAMRHGLNPIFLIMFHRFLVFAPVLLGLATASVPLSARAAQPRNIVFVLTDDHRFDAAGFMGHPFLETPNLDALARQGAHVTNAFVTTSLCSPSRASILTR